MARLSSADVRIQKFIALPEVELQTFDEVINNCTVKATLLMKES